MPWALSWIEIFANPQSWLLLTLLLVNLSEAHDHPLGLVRGSSGIGLARYFMALFSLAQHYHQRALRLAEQIQKPAAVGQARLGVAIHESFLGNWQGAAIHFQHAADAYEQVGDLHEFGTATHLATWSAFTLGAGDPERVLAKSREIVQLGIEAADPQLHGFGLHAHGYILGIVTLMSWRGETAMP